jgi:hypothetical protein
MFYNELKLKRKKLFREDVYSKKSLVIQMNLMKSEEASFFLYFPSKLFFNVQIQYHQ